MNEEIINNINISAKNIQGILKDYTFSKDEKIELIKLAANKILEELKAEK